VDEPWTLHHIHINHATSRLERSHRQPHLKSAEIFPPVSNPIPFLDGGGDEDEQRLALLGKISSTLIGFQERLTQTMGLRAPFPPPPVLPFQGRMQELNETLKRDVLQCRNLGIAK